MMEFMYIPYQREISAFGDNWCGPEMYSHMGNDLVAIFKREDGGDGQTVHVSCCACPARFYVLRVLAGENSANEPLAAYEVGTGTGQEKIAAQLAKLISEGMIEFRASIPEGK